MKKNKILPILVTVALIIGVLAVVKLVVTTPEESSTGAEVVAESSEGESSGTDATAVSEDSQKDAAKALIGKSVSREDVEAAVGEWNDFQMSSEGCERGVYAGRFYYDGFTIFSRTYDKGQTFSIVSINE